MTIRSYLRRQGRDIELKYDMFMPQPDMSSKGVGVLFK